jgi:hypothetical protein
LGDDDEVQQKGVNDALILGELEDEMGDEVS